MSRTLQPREVLLKHEDAATVGPERLVDPIAVEKAVIEDGDHGCLPVYEPVIEVDPHSPPVNRHSLTVNREEKCECGVITVNDSRLTINVL